MVFRHCRINPRLGRTCSLPTIKVKTLKLRKNTLEVRFKNALDAYLKSVPNKPQVFGYTQYRRADQLYCVDLDMVRCLLRFILILDLPTYSTTKRCGSQESWEARTQTKVTKVTKVIMMSKTLHKL